MMIETTGKVAKPVNTSFSAGLAELIELMDFKTIDRFWDEQINSLDRKLTRFHQEFHIQFAGYSPDFMSDVIHAKKLQLPS